MDREKEKKKKNVENKKSNNKERKHKMNRIKKCFLGVLFEQKLRG